MAGNYFKVSHSKVKTWLRCYYAYYLRYCEKLRRKRKSRPLMFGSIFHEMFEAHVNGEDPFKRLREIEREQGKTFRVLAEEYGEIVTDARIIFQDYLNYWDKKGGVTYLRMKSKNAEHSLEIEIAPGIKTVAKIDNYARTKDKLRWLVERKTFGKMPSEDHRWRSMQSGLYVRLTEMVGLPPVDGTMWDYIYSRSPSTPQILKGGQISKKAINTLPSRIEEFLEERKGVSSSDRKRLMTVAENNQRNYFQRIFMPVKKKVVDSIFADFVATSKMMADTHGKLKMKNIDQHCSWCDYEAICRAELTGTDATFIRKKDYEVSKGGHETEPDFEG